MATLPRPSPLTAMLAAALLLAAVASMPTVASAGESYGDWKKGRATHYGGKGANSSSVAAAAAARQRQRRARRRALSCLGWLSARA